VFTGQPVTALTIKENEPAMESATDRQVRFDVSVKFNDGRLAEVEMTMSPKRFEPVRAEYYAARLLTSQEIRGAEHDYTDLKDVYQISFLDNRVFFDDELVVHTFEFRSNETSALLGGKTRVIMVELEKFEKSRRVDIDGLTRGELWAYFIKYSASIDKRVEINRILKKEEGILMAAESLLTISKSEQEEHNAREALKRELDWQSYIVDAKRTGMAEGVEKTLKLLAGGYTPEQVREQLVGGKKS
jgi:predicted transposase/invertase (TIGR01784 family)